MLFALICTDKQPEGLTLRKDNRNDHLAYLKSLGDKMKSAGPFMTDNGEAPTGSLVIVEVDSIEDARKIAAEDPYAKAGVFQQVDIRAWNWLFGKPQGI